MGVKESAIILLSGGLDSTVNLFEAHHAYKIGLVLTFDYGQRAAEREVQSSKLFCKTLGVPVRIVELPWFKEFTSTALVQRSGSNSQSLPKGIEVQISDLDHSQKTAQAVWVPNRNGIFLNIAAGFAEGLGASVVVTGFNLEEAETFPDNSEPYLLSLNQAFSFSTSNHVKVHSFTLQMRKDEIFRRALALNIPMEHLWPCYEDGPSPCQLCESCQRFLRAKLSLQHSFKNGGAS